MSLTKIIIQFIVFIFHYFEEVRDEKYWLCDYIFEESKDKFWIFLLVYPETFKWYPKEFSQTLSIELIRISVVRMLGVTVLSVLFPNYSFQMSHLHALKPVDHSWQTVVHDAIYVYSAFRDDRMKKGQIKIIGSSRFVLLRFFIRSLHQ